MSTENVIQYEELPKHPTKFAKHDVKIKKRKHRGKIDRNSLSVQLQEQERRRISL